MSAGDWPIARPEIGSDVVCVVLHVAVLIIVVGVVDDAIFIAVTVVCIVIIIFDRSISIDINIMIVITLLPLPLRSSPLLLSLL